MTSARLCCYYALKLSNLLFTSTILTGISLSNGFRSKQEVSNRCKGIVCIQIEVVSIRSFVVCMLTGTALRHTLQSGLECIAQITFPPTGCLSSHFSSEFNVLIFIIYFDWKKIFFLIVRQRNWNINNGWYGRIFFFDVGASISPINIQTLFIIYICILLYGCLGGNCCL